MPRKGEQINNNIAHESGTGGTGAVPRDYHGSFIAAACTGLPFVEDAFTAEATELHNGLLLAAEMGCNNLEVEMDCLDVVQVMQDEGNSLGAAAAIFEECTFISRSFNFISFSFFSRSANSVADDLASRAGTSSTSVWKDDPPVSFVMR